MGGDIPGPGSCSSSVCGKLKEARRTKPATSCTCTLALPWTSTSNLLHFLPPTWTQWARHPYSSLQLICSQASMICSVPFVMSSWGLCSVTFKQDHSLPVGQGPIYTHCQSLVEGSAPTVPELLRACTKCRQISHPPHSPLQRRDQSLQYNSQCHEHEWPQNFEDFAKSSPDQLFTVWQVASTSTKWYW